MHKEFNIYRLSENAISIQFGNTICEETLMSIATYNSLLHRNPFPGFIASTPAYTTLTVFFNLVVVQKSTQHTGYNAFEKVSKYLLELNSKSAKADAVILGDIIEIPVCYQKLFGNDLNEVSAHSGLSIDEVINLHTSPLYIVHMIGFVPGFPYLGGMDARLSIPRKNKVNISVPAGAVGIAGAQTGIYPMSTPGGWHIIGQTPLIMFDINRARPSYLKAGDRVRFKSISIKEFEQYQQR